MTKPNQNLEQHLTAFGLTSFRRGQLEVVRSVVENRDTLCIMPTGGGKSLCYQLPTVAREGTTIVVSPLIALMKDQVDSLQEIGIPSTLINSSISQDEQGNRIRAMKNGEYKLVYIAPERLRSSSFMRAIQETRIQMLAIDEAHCISQWGHDFRPDYARLGRFRERIGNPQTIALTATATKLVREDICNILQLNEPAAFVSGFARENLSLNVESSSSNHWRDNRLIEFLNETEGAGIVYASTRKNCEHIVELLNSTIGRQVAFYHAGLMPERRREVQDLFMTGEVPIVVATNAFGMGIDKSDLRFVVHYNLPGSVEAYYQEAGRAGRDGKPSKCLMFYSYQDRFIQEFFIENSYPSKSIVKEVYEYLRDIDAEPIELTLMEIKDELGLSIGTEAISTCENLLEKAGVLERLDSAQNMAAVKIDSDLHSLVDYLPREATVQRKVLRALEKRVGNLRNERIFFNPRQLAADLEMKWEAISRAIRQICKLDAIDYVPPFRGRALHLLMREKKFHELQIDFTELERRKQAEFQKLESMIRLASTNRCRQMEILDYFGDPESCQCGKCDNCASKNKNAKRISSDSDAASDDACLYAVQVALSGVARTHGRIGKTLVAQMLTGSNSKKVKGLGLHRLSTFGLLKLLRQSDASALLEWLIDFGYAKQLETTKFRPVIQITQQGDSLMRGENDFESLSQLPDQLVRTISKLFKGKKPHRIEAADGADEKSTSASTEKAADEKTPESDLGELVIATTNEVVEPDSDGVVPAENELVATPESKTKTRIDPENPKGANGPKPSYFWTWKLLNDGYSRNEVQEARQIDASTYSKHLALAAENQLESEAVWLLTDQEIRVIEEFIGENQDATTAMLVSRLPTTISSQQLLYYLNSTSCSSI